MGLDKDDNYLEPLPCPEPKTCSFCKYSSTNVFTVDGVDQCSSYDCHDRRRTKKD